MTKDKSGLFGEQIPIMVMKEKEALQQQGSVVIRKACLIIKNG